MTALLEPQVEEPRRAPSAATRDDIIVRRPPARRDAFVVFAAALSTYLVAGWNLVVRHHAVVGDAMARVANGSYVVLGRDPHLAAIGFVWNPLPSIAAVPPLLVGRLVGWDPMRTQAYAGTIVSATFMAAAIAIIWTILRDYGLDRWTALALTVAVGLHPLVYQYGANGDSEAALLCFLALACLGVLRYLERGDLRSLMVIGSALGLGYLSRQEFLAAGITVVATVAVVRHRSSGGPRAARRWSALTDATLAALPFGFAVVAWAGSALILVGTATAYLDVNAQQVGAARSGIRSVVGGDAPIDRLEYFAGQVARMEPALLLVLIVAAGVALRRRDVRVVAPLVTFGAVAIVQGGLFGAGSTFGWLRFTITVVPLTALLVGTVLAPRDPSVPTRSDRWRAVRAGAPALIAMCLVALPLAARSMADPRWGREEATGLHLLPGYAFAGTGRGAYAPGWLDGYGDAARWIERHDRARDLIVTDTQYTFPLLLKTAEPDRFVIPSDRDFERTLADPATFDATYLLVSDGPGDLVAASYPELRSARRTATARLVRTFRAGPNRLRLFAVTGSVTGTDVRAAGR